MLRQLTAVVLGGTAALAVAALPGAAVDDGGTEAKLVVIGTGDLAVSGPDDTTRRQIGGNIDYSGDATAVTWPSTDGGLDAAGVIGSVAAVADHSGQLGVVTVQDDRSGLLPSWTATVDWTDFALVGGDGSAAQTIAASQIRYLSGPSTVTPDSALGVFVPSLVPVLDGGQAAGFTGLGLVGSGQSSWDPTIFVDVQGEIPGEYHGTVTHSVTAG